MTHSQLLTLLDEANTSPEEFGQLIGLSGMTLRRWSKHPKNRKISKLYLPAIREGCYQLIAQNKLNSNSPLILSILSEMPSNFFRAAVFNLDLTDKSSSGSNSRDQILESLSKVGLQNKMQSEVNNNEKKVLSFKKLGKEWSLQVTLLWKIIQSRKFTRMDKMIAYGALFYLLTPIDFIPDHIPIFGLLDDFGVLGIAATYYQTKFSDKL